MHNNTGLWMNAVIHQLFAAEDRRLDRITSDLNRKNCEALGKIAHGFRHQGMRFIPLDLKQTVRQNPKQPLPPLASSLVPQADELIRDIKQTADDRTQIRQLFVRLLDPCISTQDIRDALPDCVAPLMPDLDKLPRTNPDPTWTIRHDERALRQYDKLIPKIEMYAVTRMIY